MWSLKISSLKRIVKDSFNKIRTYIGELGRAFIMLALLRPAAYFLPKKWSLYLVNIIGFLITFLSIKSWSEKKKMQRVFGQDSGCITQQWITRPFRDYLIVRRIILGRENIFRWLIKEENVEAVEEYRHTGASFIIATGHFAREAVAALYSVRIVPQKLVTLVAPLTPLSLDPYAIRIRTQYGNFLEAFPYLHPEIEILSVGKQNIYNIVLQRLSEPGHVLITAADAPWLKTSKGHYRCPFAAHLNRVFAMGLARLSRLSQRPIVVCIPYLQPDGQIVLEWSDPIPAPPIHEKREDKYITNKILLKLEHAIGKRPSQYVLDIGENRRWNTNMECWESIEEPTS